MKKNVLLSIRVGAYLKNLIWLSGLSLCSTVYAVGPGDGFGRATHVKVGSMVTTQGSQVDLMEARRVTDSKVDIFRGVSEFKPDKGIYYSTSRTTVNVRNIKGVMSANSVPAVIEHQVSKRKVIDEILQKARTGGRALGKGAAGLGRVAATRTPYGLAFALALEGLAGSKFFWDDEKGDFVRQKDDNTYIVFFTTNTLVSANNSLDENSYKRFCARENVGCGFISYVQGMKNARETGLRFCESVFPKTDSRGNEIRGDISFSVHQTCKKGITVSSHRIHISKWLDTVPITSDEFFDESEPDADANADEWVKTSEVEPTDEPKVEVPAGTVAQTNPYTDPQDGKTKQTRWDFEPNGRVRETVIPRPDLTPDSPEAPELKPPAEETPNDKDGDKDKDKDSEKDGENEKDKEKSETEDLCEKNPDIVACDKQPEKPELDEFPEISTETVNLKFEPDSIFPNAGQCPAPVAFQAMGGTYEISTQPICDIAIKMRPFIIALAYLAAAFFVIRVIKSET